MIQLFDKKFQWSLSDEPGSIELEYVWQKYGRGRGNVIAILDSGISQSADDMIENILPGYDFISDVSLSMDGDGRDNDPHDPINQFDDECPHFFKFFSIL
jgi:serine protease